MAERETVRLASKAISRRPLRHAASDDREMARTTAVPVRAAPDETIPATWIVLATLIAFGAAGTLAFVIAFAVRLAWRLGA